MRPLLAALAAAVAVIGAAPLAAAAAPPAAAVRVDQLGYAPGESKIAHLLAEHAHPGAPFTVVDSAGAVVLSGSSPASDAYHQRPGVA
jgi:endoglucanase